MGALVAGLRLGMVQPFTIAYVSSGLSDAIIFSLLFAALLLRPTGLFRDAAQGKTGGARMTDFIAGYIPLFNLVDSQLRAGAEPVCGVAEPACLRSPRPAWHRSAPTRPELSS